MGLDMYLSKRHYVKNWDHTPVEFRHTVTVTRAGQVRQDINPDAVTYVTEECAYWRKANAIHKFFVDTCQEGVDDCRDFAYVSRETLVDLLSRCRAVLKDITLAPTLLPTESGFFFGDTLYDEYYREDLQHTVDVLKAEFDTQRDVGVRGYTPEYGYHSSW
jgi:hypothetical protein